MIDLREDDESHWDTAGRQVKGGTELPQLKYRCPTCKKALRAADVEIHFENAPKTTARQKVRGFVCSEGHQWPEPSVMQEAHAKAFTAAVPDSEIEENLAILRMAVKSFGLEEAFRRWQVPDAIKEVIRERLRAESRSRVPGVHVISAGGPQSWYEGYDTSKGPQWLRMRSYLLQQRRRTLPEISSLDDASDEVLSHLGSPLSGAPPFRTQGLVMGYVQSGKTANFSATIAKAADAGYRLVLVLAGIHNSLRLQTQRRLERELGIAPTEGMPELEEERRWVTLTRPDLHGDFQPGTVGVDVLRGGHRILLVAKKNATVLRRLVNWLPAQTRFAAPTLIIDDEADQASINTGGNRPSLEDTDLPATDLEGDNEKELDPSTINGLVRDLIRKFDRVSYVAYTATPFANILINHEAFDAKVHGDLYPKDFIISLERQEGYVGAERLFGRLPLAGETEARPGLDVIELVPEEEVSQIVPASAAEVDAFDPVLVSSLKTAFSDFVLAAAARLVRSDKDIPATMLVHTHHRQVLQDRLAKHLREHVKTFRQEWRYDKEKTAERLAARWEQEFRPLIARERPGDDVEFVGIREGVTRLFKDPLPVLVLNSTSEAKLDFDETPTFKGVLVGGNRLSRGLTIEGLLVSYYVRVTNQYDSLMQMGRWFGYREDHVELTRLYTTSELSRWFRDLSLAEEELRHEIARYERERLTPLDFGPRIRAHPAMIITAKNKMGSARTIQQNYSGRLLQTIMFRLDDRPWLTSNLRVTREFLARLGKPGKVQNSHLSWEGVGVDLVDEFLNAYRTDPRATSVDADLVRRYIAAQQAHGQLTRWWVSVRSQKNAHGLETVNLGVKGHAKINTINRSQLKSSPGSIGTLVSPATLSGAPGSGDEEVGLSPEAVAQARAAVAAERHDSLGEALRAMRDPAEGLLLIYPISKKSRPGPNATDRIALFDTSGDAETVIGIALAFPASKSAATVEYVIGSVGGEG